MHPKSWTLLEVHVFVGKTGRKNKVYSAEFKTCVIMDMRKHHLSYHETVRKYELGNDQTGGARATLQRWERIYLEEGAEVLMILFKS